MTPENIREILDYRDGVLYWKHNARRSRQWNGHYPGKVAGTTDRKGYVVLIILDRETNLKRKWQAHRLIFCLHHGYMPVCVDHINGEPSDNRIDNLRAATKAQNCANRVVRKDAMSGHLGVSYRSRDKNYQVEVMFSKRRHYIGSFKNIDDAKRASDEARERIVGEWRRGAAL